MIINTGLKKTSNKPDKKGEQPDELRLPKWI